MIYIAFRGLFQGENPQTENTPNQVSTALNNGYSAMVDVWRVDNKLYLGTDQPLYEVTEKYLQNPRIWLNCRNADMQTWIATQSSKKYPHHFNQPTDLVPYVMTSDNYYWTFDNIPPDNNLTVMAQPESYDIGLFSTVHLRCYGIASMFLKFIKRIRNDTGYPFFGDINIPY